MSNTEIINPYEGQTVDTIAWPFYRYSALIPESIGGDMFVWLYLSLVVYTNGNKGLPKENYSEEVKTEVSGILRSKFAAVIDEQTLEKIIRNAEDKFIKKNVISQETFSFLDTYENLFSDKLEVKYVYQDAVSGEVLPFYGDTSFLEDSTRQTRISLRVAVKEPSKKSVQNSYKQYMRLTRFNSQEEDVEVELEDEYFDEDEQTFFGQDEEPQTFEIEKEEPKSLRNYNVIFLKDQRALFNLDGPLIVQDNALIVRSPLDRLTDPWMNKCLKKGRNVSQELDAVIEDYEASYLIAEKKIESFIEGHKKDFASSLKNCQTLYRIIDALDDNRMREYVVKLDSMYTEQNELFYFYCGKILDRLIRLINYKGKTPGVQRKQTTYDAFCSEIDYALSRTPITYYFLKTKNIYDNWRKKDDRKDGKEFISFKADLTDIMIRTDLKKSPIMYPLFLQDAFNLYAKRSKVDHDDDDSMVDHEIQSSEIDTLTKVVKVLFELI